MLVDLSPWSISHVSSHTFLLGLATRVTYFGPRLGGGDCASKGSLGDLDTTCNSSLFLKDIMKMACDPVSDHDKTATQSNEGKTIPLTPEEVIGGGTWKQECEQQTSFGGMSLRTKVLREHIEGLYGSYLKEWVKPPKHFILMISKSEMENCTTETRVYP